MSMKKGYCPKCKKARDEKKRVFDVNSEASVCYCPNCLTAYKPSVVIEEYNNFLNEKITNAFYQFKTIRKFKNAYKTFAKVLEFEPEHAIALSGRIASLFYLSTLRKVYFKDTMSLLMMSKHRFYLVSNRDIYKQLLNSLNVGFEEYHHNLTKRLTFVGYFYDSDCLKLFITRLNEIKEFKEYIYKEFVALDENVLAVKVSKEITVIEKALHADFYTADGIKREFKIFDEKGVPTFEVLKGQERKPLPKYLLATLDYERKGMRKINNNMFSKDQTSRNIIATILFTAGIAVIIGIILTIIGAFTPDHIARTALFLSAIISNTLAGIFILIFFFVRRGIMSKIKKKNLRSQS